MIPMLQDRTHATLMVCKRKSRVCSLSEESPDEQDDYFMVYSTHTVETLKSSGTGVPVYLEGKCHVCYAAQLLSRRVLRAVLSGTLRNKIGRPTFGKFSMKANPQSTACFISKLLSLELLFHCATLRTIISSIIKSVEYGI